MTPNGVNSRQRLKTSAVPLIRQYGFLALMLQTLHALGGLGQVAAAKSFQVTV
jgi:hypothetical protein